MVYSARARSFNPTVAQKTIFQLFLSVETNITSTQHYTSQHYNKFLTNLGDLLIKQFHWRLLPTLLSAATVMLSHSSPVIRLRGRLVGVIVLSGGDVGEEVRVRVRGRETAGWEEKEGGRRERDRLGEKETI